MNIWLIQLFTELTIPSKFNIGRVKLLGGYLTNKKINLKKEIIKNDRLIANLKIKNQVKLTNKIKETQESTQLKI